MTLVEKHLRLYRSLSVHKVKYLLIGGVACGVHGSPRATVDIDLLIEPTQRNAKRLLAALSAAGFGTASLTAPDQVVAHELSVFEDWVRIDVLTRAKGLTFDAAWRRRVDRRLGGVTIHLVSLDDLIRSKRAAGRPIDRADVAVLHQIRRRSATR